MSPKRGRRVSENIDRWTHRTASRVGFRDPRRPPFERGLFEAQMAADHPGYPVELVADKFKAALDLAQARSEATGDGGYSC
jgi:predicted RNase H-like nuclease (RuvC/YqgF family)